MNKYQKQNAFLCIYAVLFLIDFWTMKNIWTDGTETSRVKYCIALNGREYFDWICNHDYDVGFGAIIYFSNIRVKKIQILIA